MVLNLIIKSTIDYIRQQPALNIAACQNLLFKKSGYGTMFNDRHAFMVGSKNKTEIYSEKSALHYDPEKPLPPRKKEKYYSKIKYKMNYGKKEINNGFWGSLSEKIRNTCILQVPGFSHKHWDKEQTLVLYYHSIHSFFLARLIFKKSKECDINIWVKSRLIGKCVMPVVFLRPPFYIPSGTHAKPHTHHPVHAPTRDLPVSDIMEQECHLTKYKRKKYGIEHLYPKIADSNKNSYAK